MEKSSLIIITLCVATNLTLSAITSKIIKRYDSDKVKETIATQGFST